MVAIVAPPPSTAVSISATDSDEEDEIMAEIEDKQRDEEDEAAAAGDLGEKLVRSQQAAHGFAQIDDMDEIAFAVDIRPHLGIPTTRPVSEMDAGFDQVLNLDNGHARPSCDRVTWPEKL